MAETVIYKVCMEASGRMTQLPDSQKIFGALVYLYAEQTSDAKATQFVEAVKEKRLKFSLSNLMPNDYLPVPEGYLLEQMAEMELGGKRKELYKGVKKRKFIKLDQLKTLINEPQQVTTLFPYIQIDESQEIHAAIDSIRYQLPGLDPNLYSVPEITVLEVVNEGESKRVDSYYYYLELELNELGETFIQALTEARIQERLFFLGPRASQGINVYQITDIEREQDNCENSKHYLNLGMLLPGKLDFQESYIDTFTSVRLPYKNRDGWDKEITKRYISYINAGSIIYTEYEKCAAVKSIPSEYDSSRSIIFGNAILYPIHIKARRGKGEAV